MIQSIFDKLLAEHRKQTCAKKSFQSVLLAIFSLALFFLFFARVAAQNWRDMLPQQLRGKWRSDALTQFARRQP